MKTKLLTKIILSFLFVCGGIFSSQAQSFGKVETTTNTTDVTTTIHEPGVQIHEPGIVIHEPGFEIHEPGFQNQGPGHNSSDKMRMEMYPNPTVDFIHIRSEHHHFKAYSIYNNTGTIEFNRVVFDVPDHHAEINVSHLDKGLYILVIQANHSQIAVKRFVKK